MDKSKLCTALVCGCYRAEHKHVPPCDGTCFQKDLEISDYVNHKPSGESWWRDDRFDMRDYSDKYYRPNK